MYHSTFGVSKNYFKAMNLFLNASFMGHPASQINVGNMYYFGEGVDVNYSEAMQWHKKLAGLVDRESFAALRAEWEARVKKLGPRGG